MRRITLVALGLWTGCTAKALEEGSSSLSAIDARDVRVMGAIAYGDAKTTTTRARPPYRAWTFTGRAGDVLDVRATSSRGDPVLALCDADWNVLGWSDDADDLARPTDSHVAFTLPASGTYALAVRDYYGDRRRMTVALEGHAGGLDVSDLLRPDGTPDVRELGDLSLNTGWTKAVSYRSEPRYRARPFSVRSGNVVVVRVQALDGGQPFAFVTDDAWRLVDGEARPDPDSGSAQFRFIASGPGTGPYHLVWREASLRADRFQASGEAVLVSPREWGETLCDATPWGHWADDDADEHGEYCVCDGDRRFLPAEGGCVPTERSRIACETDGLGSWTDRCTCEDGTHLDRWSRQCTDEPEGGDTATDALETIFRDRDVDLATDETYRADADELPAAARPRLERHSWGGPFVWRFPHDGQTFWAVFSLVENERVFVDVFDGAGRWFAHAWGQLQDGHATVLFWTPDDNDPTMCACEDGDSSATCTWLDGSEFSSGSIMCE